MIANWLRSNPSTPLLATIPGAGTLVPAEAAIVRAIYTKINASIPGGWRGDCVDGYCGFLRSFEDVILHPEIDYCQHRVAAIWSTPHTHTFTQPTHGWKGIGLSA